ncbi:putative ABC transporter ATP-binding protein [Rickettsiales bacterium Ac37b]|nr:putative ABC transporter ATP-binding protein [Rickettsiales bacterium Ac37b]
MTQTPKIKISNLHKKFGSKNVLSGVNLSVQPGQSLVIIGGSGSGKSVLLKNIIGLINADTGSIEIDGKETTRLSSGERNKLMKKFGLLFQNGALFDSMTVWQNIAFGLQDSTSKEAKDLAINTLKLVGLDQQVAELYPAELSGGMQKRVALARAIAYKPEIIFFDEPTTGLDPIMANVINNLIVKCSKELGATTITITHDLNSARIIADRVAMIFDGKIIWDGSIENIDSVDNPYVAQFIAGSTNGPIKIEGYT